MKNSLIGSTACLLVAMPAWQAAQAQASLPPITVTATRNTDEGALTSPTTEQARSAMQRIPGAVEVVADTAFKQGPAQTIKDVLGWVPGVFAQSRYGDDARVSIRGSGLSRNYGNRGINIYMDGIPVNTSDGLVDLFEIDPTAYRYVEVYKGANALRYSANALGAPSTSSRRPAGTPPGWTAGSTRAASAI